MLILQVTNAEVRRPGYEASYLHCLHYVSSLEDEHQMGTLFTFGYLNRI